MHSLNIQLPDSDFTQAARAAAANGVTVEAFVAEAVHAQLSLHEEEALLTSEQIAKVRQAQAEIRAGDFLTSEQVDEHFATKKAAWKQSNLA